MHDKHTEGKAMVTVNNFDTRPLEQWTPRDYYTALGAPAICEALNITPNNLRIMCSRGRMSLERITILQNIVLQDEQKYRRALASINTGITYRGPTKPNTTNSESAE